MEMKRIRETTHPVFPRGRKEKTCVQIPFRIKAAGKQQSIDHVQEVERCNLCVCVCVCVLILRVSNK